MQTRSNEEREALCVMESEVVGVAGRYMRGKSRYMRVCDKVREKGHPWCMMESAAICDGNKCMCECVRKRE